MSGDSLFVDIDFLREIEGKQAENGAKKEGELVAKPAPERRSDDRHDNRRQVGQRDTHRQRSGDFLTMGDFA